MPADQLLTINISPRTIEAPHFSTDALLSILNRNAIHPGRVVVELTEREKVEDIARLQSTLNAMKRAGLRIAADDVGAGNAGLRLLSQFRFDIVKIDLSLVQDGAEHDTSRAVLRSLRDLAGRWGCLRHRRRSRNGEPAAHGSRAGHDCRPGLPAGPPDASPDAQRHRYGAAGDRAARSWIDAFPSRAKPQKRSEPRAPTRSSPSCGASP